MALTDDALDALTDRGWGPLTFDREGDHHVAHLGGRRATVKRDGPTLRVDVHRQVEWPTVGGADEAAQRVLRMLAELEMARAELLTVTANPDSQRVAVTLWLDAEQATPHDLAVGVRTVLHMGQLAVWTVDNAQASLAVDADLQRLADEAQQTVQEAERPPYSTAGPPPRDGSTWCRVDAPTDVYGLQNTSQVVGRLQPSTWYRLLRRAEGWAEVAHPDGAFDGWVRFEQLRPPS